jgi:MFS family permease
VTHDVESVPDRPPFEVEPAPYPARVAWVALAILVLLVVFAMVDRVALPLQAERIRIAFALSDFQLGLLQDTGGAIFAALVTYPLAWLADRFDRRWVLALCLVTWSSAAALCGLAPSFTAILIASSFLAAGGAGVLPIAQAFIASLFNGQKRQTANALFYVCTTAGSALAQIGVGALTGFIDTAHATAGSAVASWDPWRLVFLAVALPAPFFLLLLPLLPRVQRAPPKVAEPNHVAEGSASLASFVRERPLVLLGVFGALALFAFGQSAVSVWTTVVAMRNFGQTPAQVGTTVGVMLLVLLPLALGINLLVIKRLAVRHGVTASMRMMRYAFLLAAPLLVVLMFTRTVPQFYGTFFVLNLVLLPAMMNLPGLLQSLGASAMLSRIFAINVVVSTFCAAASGPIVGLISDSMKDSQFGLLTATAGTGAVALALAAVTLILVEPSYAAHARKIEADRAKGLEGATAAPAA